MHKITHDMKGAIIDGFFALLPVLLILLILEETLLMITDLVEPLAKQLPGKEILGVGLAHWLAIFLILIVFMLVGYISYTKFGRDVGGWFDDHVMRRLPGYQILKSISKQFSGKSEEVLLAPVLFTTDAGIWMFAFILDEFDNGYYSLFVPTSPTPMMGTVQYVDQSRVKKLDIPPGKVLDNLMSWGIDSKSMLDLKKYVGES